MTANCNHNWLWRRRVATISGLIMLMMPLLHMIWIGARQMVVQQQMKERMEYAMLHTIRIPKSDFLWHKKDKEIIYKGHFFDVKTIQTKEDVYELTGLYDYEETALEHMLEQRAGKQGNNAIYDLRAELIWGIALPHDDVLSYDFEVTDKLIFFDTSNDDLLPGNYDAVLRPPIA